MTKRELLSLIEEITEVSPGTLSGDEPIVGLEGWDSLAVIAFIAKIDELFEITLSPKKIAKAKTLSDLIDLTGVVNS